MSFTAQLWVAFTFATLATLLTVAFGPLVADAINILNANIVASTAIGLPIVTTASMLIAVIALQR
ncbi:MAG: hypothetical protein KDJ47_12255 [Hyphomicrobiaceae bacterium]|nr:hypothetical protein [Hyphomicrobiaceae bacterium]